MRFERTFTLAGSEPARISFSSRGCFWTNRDGRSRFYKRPGQRVGIQELKRVLMMKNLTIHKIEDVAPYAGEHAIPGIRFRAVREAMGVESWGMNVLELDPNCEGYPEHEHKKDGQEELYVILDGQAELVTDGHTQIVETGHLVRVGPTVTRKFITKDHGVRILALGGTPGKAYSSK